jgi:hypothetical protein
VGSLIPLKPILTKNEFRILQPFLFKVNIYVMRLFTYEIVLLDIPFLKKVADPKRRFEISAGSYKFQRGQ